MKRDAHYYAILAFSRACGFRKEWAHEIAYASQFVADATINHITIKGTPPKNISYEKIDGCPCFFDMATGHTGMRIKTFNFCSMINSTVAFHFIPGCEGTSFTKKLRCREEASVIVNILQETFESGDLMRLGVALHAFADSFSHHGFSGILSKVNNIRNLKAARHIVLSDPDRLVKIGIWSNRDKVGQRFDSAVPAYGHGQALEYPDIPYATWSYQYDGSDDFSEAYTSTGTIHNRQRFSKAFDKIQDYFEMYLREHRRYLDPEMNYRNFHILFEALLYERPFKEREKNWRKVLVMEGLFDPLDRALRYEEDLWLKQSFTNYQKHRFRKRRVEDAELCQGFAKSPWYRYYSAVKWFKERFLDYCAQYGLDIPR